MDGMKSLLRTSFAGTLSLVLTTGCADLQEPLSMDAITQVPPMSVSRENSLPISRKLLLEELQQESTSWFSLRDSPFWETQPAAQAHAPMKPPFPIRHARVIVPVHVPHVPRVKAVVIPVRRHAPAAAIVRHALITSRIEDPIAEPSIVAVFASFAAPAIESPDSDAPAATDMPETTADAAAPTPQPSGKVPTSSEIVPVVTPRNDAVYSSLEYESRFGDAIFGADVFSLGVARTVQTYGVLHSSGDTRSSASGVAGPIIYNDNAEIIGGGVRINLSTHSTSFLFAEVGEGFSLVGRGNHPDFRYGYDSWSEKGSASRAHTSYGFSAASYSRYGANIIGYGSMLHDFPLRPWMRGIVGANAALDTHRDYFNNIGEIEAGVRLGTPNLQLRLLGVAGTYLSRGVGIPISRPYTSFRPAIFWSRQL
jgi:hypothetical protein